MWQGANVIVYPAFVKDFRSISSELPYDNFAVNGCRDVCLTSSEKLIFFEELRRKYGLKVNFKPLFTVGGCGATILNYFVVGPEGELYKCWNDIGDKDSIVGNVLDDIVGSARIHKQLVVDASVFHRVVGGNDKRWHVLADTYT